jgi:predicted DNA-binding transcriptional regulator AlpA
MPDLIAVQPHERLISVAAAAQQFGVDVATLMRWHRSRHGPTGRLVGGQLAYRGRDITAWQDRMGESLPA